MSDKPTVIEPGELVATSDDEPPVVARLVIEIRSDGSRTIARGAMEERASGQSVAIEARGDSPLELAVALAKMITKVPLLGRASVRALLPKGASKKKPPLARRLLRRLRRGGRGGDGE